MNYNSLSRLNKALLVVGAIAFVYGANYILTPTLVGERLELSFRPHFNSKFDSNLWLKTGPTTWKVGGPPYGKRYEMVDDLLRSGMLRGLDKEQLSTMLGAPDLAAPEQAGELRCFYILADQRTYPARSIWFPGLFANQDRWMLEIRLRDGKFYMAKVFFT